MMSPRKSWRRLSLAAALVVAEMLAAPAVRAQSGDPDAQYRAGFAAFQKRDYADACKEFQAAAAQGHVASKSMIQIVNGYGYRCAMPSARTAAAASLPAFRQLYQRALGEARAWHGDAALTYAQVSRLDHPGYFTTSFLFVSPATHETLSLVSAQDGGIGGKLDAATKARPLPANFIDLSAAVEDARRAGMQGAVDNATLTVWQGKGGPQLAGWMLHAPENRAGTFLIGALDGRAYPVGEYTYPVEANDAQLRAMHQAAPQPSGQQASGGSCSTALSGFCCGQGVRYFSSPSEGLKCPGDPCVVVKITRFPGWYRAERFAGRACW
jgi:hypothetical protein